MTTTELNKDVLNQAIDYLKENKDYLSCYGSDLHHQIFNTDYFIIGRYKAEQWLIKNVGVFQAISDIKDYEMDNFGQIATNLSEPEHVCNMWVYIEGERVLGESTTLANYYGRRLDAKTIETIINELENL